MIKEAAIKFKGKIYTGKRHCDCIMKAGKDTKTRPINGEQGFLTTKGDFVDREEAAIIALESGQIKELKFHKTMLYSEDLY